MAMASGASREAVGTIVPNTSSKLELKHPSAQVIITNNSGEECLVRLNWTVSPQKWDIILQSGDHVAINEIWIESVHVRVDASDGIMVVYW